MHAAYEHLFKLVHPQQTDLAKNDNVVNDLAKSYSLSEKEMSKQASDLIRQNILRLNIYLEVCIQ